jgi:hypothetical protein
MHYLTNIVGLSLLLLLAACASTGAAPTATPAPGEPPAPTAAPPPTLRPSVVSTAGTATGEQRFPDIVDAELTPRPDGSFDIAVTVSSPYDSPERYADAWRVLAPDGTQLAERVLLHDHANEQPFTRRISGVEIPSGISEVTIEGRDKTYGYGGQTMTVAVPER